ncbi:MAG: glutathione peroxidase [Acidobacteriota bacterium]|nr:glutathione peroxidase [Acidobacteriota bacterium]
MSAAIYEIPVQTISGATTTLAAYRGKVLLIVNVASKCGLTPQYDALEKLFSRFKESGFVVLGFPANDFAGQEPGSNEEIATFCKATFAVDFPIFAKIAVTGQATHPLYQELIREFPGTAGESREEFRRRLSGFLSQSGSTTNPDPGILWNFEKFLVGRDGRVLARFSPEITPDDPQVTTLIEKALAER